MPDRHTDPSKAGSERPARGAQTESDRRPAEPQSGQPVKRKRCGKPRILSDTEDHFTFTVHDPGLADNEALRFEKSGHSSWIETVKWAQRNGKNVCVRYDERDVGVLWIDDELFNVYPPTDVFELP